MVELEREEMVAGLKSAIVEVVFEKVNGDERILVCTLHPSHLPEVKKTDKVKVPNMEVVNVWEVNLKEWRSFRVDSVLEYNVLSDS